MSESIVYDLTQEILNYREDSRSVIGTVALQIVPKGCEYYYTGTT
jgi:hypothetical protein